MTRVEEGRMVESVAMEKYIHRMPQGLTGEIVIKEGVSFVKIEDGRSEVYISSDLIEKVGRKLLEVSRHYGT